jgi:bacterial/archaeal transporter family protein
MTWLYLAILSGLLLGVYDLLKKQSVNGNAVLPVLLFSNLSAALVWVPLLILGRLHPELLPHPQLLVEPISLKEHGLLFLKSCLVGSSWLFAYFAVKHLPISIAGSVRSTGPVFTIAGALLLYRESPNSQQWIGILITVLFFIALSRVGKREGIHFENNGWIWLLLIGTLLGSCSGLYDKYLLGTYGFSPATVQAWFSIYLFVYMLIPMLGWMRGWWPHSQFHWRWSIPAIGLSLLVVDFLYFKAMADPDAMVSVIACLRRGAVLVTFFAGTILFKEKLFWRKLPCVLGILSGILIILTS